MSPNGAALLCNSKGAWDYFCLPLATLSREAPYDVGMEDIVSDSPGGDHGSDAEGEYELDGAPPFTVSGDFPP